MAPLELVDPATNPYLSGRFAPVHREITADDLTVEGSLPDELVGAYVRNGPNPKFPPLGSYTFPMEGDGMLHGVWLEAGRARYRNRWVETAGLRAEERAGKALFGGLMTPAFVDPSLLGPDPDPDMWDASEFPGPPRARVRIPQRVPNGLHGNWFPAE